MQPNLIPSHVLLTTVVIILLSDVKFWTKKRKKESGSLDMLSSSPVSISSPIPAKMKELLLKVNGNFFRGKQLYHIHFMHFLAMAVSYPILKFAPLGANYFI